MCLGPWAVEGLQDSGGTQKRFDHKHLVVLIFIYNTNTQPPNLSFHRQRYNNNNNNNHGWTQGTQEWMKKANNNNKETAPSIESNRFSSTETIDSTLYSTVHRPMSNDSLFIECHNISTVSVSFEFLNWLNSVFAISVLSLKHRFLFRSFFSHSHCWLVRMFRFLMNTLYIKQTNANTNKPNKK